MRERSQSSNLAEADADHTMHLLVTTFCCRKKLKQGKIIRHHVLIQFLAVR